jgi:UPF0716 protein FxsA
VRFLTIFGLVALAEMATFFWVESSIGLAWALGLALTTALIGSFLVRRAGIAVLGRIRDKWAQGTVPGRELTDGAAILVAGAFLISPGFLTDTIGFLLLVPWMRGLLHQWITRRYSARISVYMPDSGPPTNVAEEEVIDVEELD